MLLQLSKHCPGRASCLLRLEWVLSPRRCSEQLFCHSSHGAGHSDGCRDIFRAVQHPRPAGSTFLPQAKRFWESTGGFFFFFQEGPDTSRHDAEQVDFFVHTTDVSVAFPLAPSLHGEDTLSLPFQAAFLFHIGRKQRDEHSLGQGPLPAGGSWGLVQQ